MIDCVGLSHYRPQLLPEQLTEVPPKHHTSFVVVDKQRFDIQITEAPQLKRTVAKSTKNLCTYLYMSAKILTNSHGLTTKTEIGGVRGISR